MYIFMCSGRNLPWWMIALATIFLPKILWSCTIHIKGWGKEKSTFFQNKKICSTYSFCPDRRVFTIIWFALEVPHYMGWIIKKSNMKLKNVQTNLQVSGKKSLIPNYKFKI